MLVRLFCSDLDDRLRPGASAAEIGLEDGRVRFRLSYLLLRRSHFP